MHSLVVVTFTIFVAIGLCSSTVNRKDVTINIIHYNDIHARYDEFNIHSTRCNASSSPCIGGFSRLYQSVKDLMSKYPHSLVLNAGDTFQGTAWYNVHRWNVTQHFINLIPNDAHALGNHEFDSGIDGLSPYLKSLRAPVLAANVDPKLEPSIASVLRKSIVIERHGRKIGIIGVTFTGSATNFRAGRLVFIDEKVAVRKEGERMRQQGVDIIIVLSHCGLLLDKQLAVETGDLIDIIVGGHSHSLLYSGHTPSNETPEGDYPVVVNHTSGNTVLIVQAASYSKYVGQIEVTFNEAGKIKSWVGKPIFLDSAIGKNSMILQELVPYRDRVNEAYALIIGRTDVKLDIKACSSTECEIGDFICDAFAEAASNYSKLRNVICIFNSRGIRNSIQVGDITHGNAMEALPFNNSVDILKLKGEDIKRTLEHSVSNGWVERPFTGPYTLQVAGLRVVFNASAPVGSRVQSAMVRNYESDDSMQYQILKMDKTYQVVTTEYLTYGGDGFNVIAENAREVQHIGVDIDVFESYVKKNSPVSQKIESRITFV